MYCEHGIEAASASLNTPNYKSSKLQENIEISWIASHKIRKMNKPLRVRRMTRYFLRTGLYELCDKADKAGTYGYIFLTPSSTLLFQNQ